MSLFLANYYIAQVSGAIPAIATLTNYKKVKTLLDELFRDYDHISEEQPPLKRLPIKDRLKLNDATMVSSALIILLQITLKISLGFVHVFMSGKLTQLVPWIYLFAIFPLVRILQKSKTVELIKQ